MKILICTLWSLILAVCFEDCLTAPITNNENRAFQRRRRPCGRDATGKSFGNAIFLGDVTITQVSCGGTPGNNKPDLFIKPGQGVKPGFHGGNKPGGNKPGGGHGFLNSIFGDGGFFGNGGIFNDGGFLGILGGGGNPGAHTGGVNPGGVVGSTGGPSGGFGGGLGNIFTNIFGGFRPQLPGVIGIGGPGGGAGPLPADPLPEDSFPDDTIPQDPVSEDEPEPIKPVFEEIPEDPVTELYKPLPLVGAPNQYVQGYSQDLTNFKPGKVISSIGKQFNHYLINPFVDLLT